MSTNLKENQLLAAQLLASGKNGKTVAEAVGVTEETISRWKKEADFKIYLMELIIENHEAAKTRLQSLIEKAVGNIETVIDDQTMPAKEKFTAAIKIIEMCGGYAECLKLRVKNMRDPFGLSFGD